MEKAITRRISAPRSVHVYEDNANGRHEGQHDSVLSLFPVYAADHGIDDREAG